MWLIKFIGDDCGLPLGRYVSYTGYLTDDVEKIFFTEAKNIATSLVNYWNNQDGCVNYQEEEIVIEEVLGYYREILPKKKWVIRYRNIIVTLMMDIG